MHHSEALHSNNVGYAMSGQLMGQGWLTVTSWPTTGGTMNLISATLHALQL